MSTGSSSTKGTFGGSAGAAGRRRDRAGLPLSKRYLLPGSRRMMLLVGLAAVFGLILLRHRALRPTLVVYLPAVLAAAGTLGGLSLIGVDLNMLSLVALLMVVCMGVDYGVFLAEHRNDETARRSTLLAILLAGTSTMLGFGLLAFSSQPPLFHIGTTAAIGVLLCMLLAPCVASLLLPRAR